MPPNVKVCINGFVLSTLLFDCTNNTTDQEGFLYGSITRNVRREISDHSMSNTQEDILISICSTVPSGNFLSFYNNVGEIKREDLEYNLAERAENIVGWYRFRRYSALFPSVREQAVHRNLRDTFNHWNRLVDTSYFIFGILSSSNLPNFATHSYDYAFYIQRRDGSFKDLPFTILNLGDTRNTYRSGSMALPFMNSSSFNSVLSNSWNFEAFFDTENQIHEFHQRLRAKLDSLQEELAASDAVNASLEDDIKRLSNEMQTLLATQDFEMEESIIAKQGEHSAEEASSGDEMENAFVFFGKRSDQPLREISISEIPMPPDEDQHNDLPAKVSSDHMDVSEVPNLAKQVELVVSDTDIQVILLAFVINLIVSLVIYGLFKKKGLHGFSVNETVSSSDELSNVKASNAKETPLFVSNTKYSDESKASKSLSDSEVSCKTENVISDRCKSAPPKFLSHMSGSAEKKVIDSSSASKSCSSSQSSKISPPFIIYAAKKLENVSSPTSTEGLPISESESAADAISIPVSDEGLHASEAESAVPISASAEGAVPIPASAEGAVPIPASAEGAVPISASAEGLHTSEAESAAGTIPIPVSAEGLHISEAESAAGALPIPVSAEGLHTDESKSTESTIGTVVISEGDQSSSQDQKGALKPDVPQESVKKVE